MTNLFNQFYSPEVLKHVKNPKNMGEIKNPDGVATVGNPVCGDIMKIYLRVGRKEGREYIKDIKFQTLGCGAAIASSSVITTLVKGKPLQEASKITKRAILKVLGGLPQSKVHCSLLADEALKKAIKNYYNRE